MKILQITPNIGSGSVGRIAEDLYYGIKEHGDDCKIAYGRDINTNIPLSDIWRIGKKLGVYIHVLYTRIFDRTALGGVSVIATRKLIKQIKEYNPDIIHLHGNYGYYINAKVLFKYLQTTNIKIVSTFHSCWDFTGHCCYFTYANCEKWKTGCYSCPEKKAFPTSYIFDNSKRNYYEKKKLFTSISQKIIVTPSVWLAEVVKKSFLSKYPVRVIYNGIDINSFKKTDVNLSKFGIDDNKPLILGVASVWSPRKGLNDFIELSKIVDDNIQIVVVGVNKKLIRKLPSKIIAIERTESKKELAALYSKATILFNPTYEDNYPTVNIESIACDTPVVTYQTGGSPECIKKYNAGFVIEKKDYKKLIDIVNMQYGKKLLISNEQRKDMSSERMVEDYIKLYSEILKEGC